LVATGSLDMLTSGCDGLSERQSFAGVP
jgi:hypothetical protein